MKTVRSCRFVTKVLIMFVVAGISLKLAAEELPSLEMLEFIGGWENDEGQSFDPVTWLDFFSSHEIERQISDETGVENGDKPESSEQPRSEDSDES